MRKNWFTLIVFFSLLLMQRVVYADAADALVNPPLETIVLKLPNNGYVNWKEMTRNVCEQDGVVEYIPYKKTSQNWSEIIRIGYCNLSKEERKGLKSAGPIVDAFREKTLSSFPASKVSWNIIEKNNNDVLYEWILQEPHKDYTVQHDVVRIFLTENGVHTIGYTHKNTKLSSSTL